MSRDETFTVSENLSSEKKKKNISILIVDDEKFIRDYLNLLLSLEGYTVTAVSNGKDALEIFKGQLNPSVILLDIIMPEMDGLETLQKIREIKKNIPVIMLSANFGSDVVNRAFELGANNFISKPFEYDDLDCALKEVL